jgi:hypothetical protein
MKKIVCLIIIILTVRSAVSQNYLFNSTWHNVTTNPIGNYDYLNSVVDANGNLIYIANEKTGNNSDIVLGCINPNGATVWSHNCNSNLNNDDYGAAIKLDASDNIYICAAKSNGANTDFFVAKYSSLGILIWGYTFNGSANGNDVPANLILDNLNNVYVVGTTQNIGTLTDITTIKLNNNGVMQWAKNFDFNNNIDAGTNIVLDNLNNVLVCGSTANNFVNAEFTVLKYNNANGTLLNTIRHVSAGNGLDLASTIDVGGNNEVFVTGTSQNGSNKSIKTLALTTNLALNWVNFIDKNNGADEGFDLKIKNNSQVIVTGYSTRTDGSLELNVTNYNSTNGNINWQHIREPENANCKLKGHKLHVRANGHILVTGEYKTASQNNSLVLGLGNNGQPLFEKTLPLQNTSNYSTRLNEKNNHLFLSGFVNNATQKQVSNIDLEFTTDSNGIVSSPNGQPLYKANQLIFRFNPNQLNLNIINNTGVTFGPLINFANSALINELFQYTGIRFTDVRTKKIFTELTSEDNISISRLSDTVEIPPFYASLLLTLPNGTNLQGVIDSVRKHLSHKVHGVEYNLLATLFAAPNDPLYTINASLKPTAQYPLSHINIEPVWQIETGKPHVKVGVYDTGFRWDHEDFGNGTFAGSVFKGGVDFPNQQPLSANNGGNNNHGTVVSSIIGALRNNGKGLAGIASGDFALSQPGVSMYGMKIYDDPGVMASLDDVCHALTFGATNVPSKPQKGLGLHIINCSWGIVFDASSFGLFSIPYILKDATRFCFKNKVTTVYARGNNNGNAPGVANGANSTIYPHKFSPDDWILNVGATGATTINTQPNIATYSDYGSGMDLLAPGSGTIFSTISPATISSYNANNPSVTGTSFSAPHVAGVAGLMCSYINQPTGSSFNNLAPEDVEQLMERYAYKYPTTAPFANNANGLLQASNIFNVITSPNYKIEHFQYAVPANLASLQSSNINVTLSGDVPFIPLFAGNYKLDVYQVTQNFSHAPTLPFLLNSWPLNSLSTPAGPLVTGSVVPEANLGLSNVSINGATATGYIFHFTNNNTTSTPMNFWYPCDLTGTLQMAYTLHTSTNPITTDIEKHHNIIASAILYPNPAQNSFVLQSNEDFWKIEVKDALGRRVYSEDFNGKIADVNCHTWQNGIYFVTCILHDGKLETLKFLKHD